MAIQTINVGNLVNDGLGDDLRTAFQKVNANFVELASTSSTTASNLGAAGLGVFKQKVGADLQFKKLVAGTKTQLTEGSETIIITADVQDAFTQVITVDGIANANAGTFLTLNGGTNTSIKAVGNVITIGETIDTIKLITSVDFGFINGAYENAIQFILAGGDYDFGTFDVPSDFDYDAGTI